MKVSYYSLGCKVNLYESEAIVNQFIENGFELGQFDEICDVYIINTCSITEVSDAKSRKIIRQATRKNSDAVVAVMGCYAQLKPEDIKAIEGVDVLVGTNNRHLLYPLVMENLENKNKSFLVDDIMKVKEYEEVKMNRLNDKTRGFIKIQDGCNNFCSYCTIPYARGTVRSRQSKDVIQEIKQLSEQGVKEIVLTGINTASYGRDFKDYRFSDLLNDIFTQVTNLGRLRISSIEITEVTDEVLEVLHRNKDKFCLHFHIPLQGGSNKVLKRMNRKYDLSYYEQRINQIRNLFPGVNITTDILAGFAGEDDEDFKSSCNFIRKIGYGEMHVFPYSRRPRTVAYEYPDHVNEITKQLRVNELLRLSEIMALEYRKSWVDKKVVVLVEKVQNGIAFGHTSNYLEVEFKGNVEKNVFVEVMITEAKYPICKGVMV